MNRRRTIALGAAALALAVLAGTCAVLRSGDKEIVVGVPDETTTTPLPAPTAPPQEPQPVADTAPAPAAGGGGGGGRVIALAPATGRPYGPAIPFHSSIPVGSDLRFVLVVGSDARPREPVDRSRADSIHLVAVNPASGTGTVVGFPRDSWVEIPGRGRGKINDAMVMGGPQLLADTVRRLTGLPVHYWVLTSFRGFSAMVDELGGVHVHVDHRMADKDSGAFFERGWHHMNGAQALAFSRNRKDVPNGDFSRSKHQGDVVLAALAKMRSEVGDDPGVFRWLDVLRRHVQLDVPADRLPELAALGRRLDPARLTNVVAPGRIGYAGRTSVVYLSQEATAMFADLRDDATLGSAPPPTTTTTAAPPTTAPPSTTTTTAPPTTEPPLVSVPEE